jgi:YbbR-like protein
VKGISGIWLKRVLDKVTGRIDKDVLIFSFFLLLSFIFWYLNSLGKNIEAELKYPVRYINLPKERVLSEELPSKLDLYLKGPGYSILKLKLSGTRAPLILDMSMINYRRASGSKTLNYYIVTTGLIPKLKNELRTECDITSIRPDTLFFSLDRIVTKSVPVVADLEVLTEKQYSVKGPVLVTPDSVMVTGPKQVMDTLTHVRTRFRKFSGVDETVIRSIPLKTPGGFTASIRKVTVTVPVEQFTEAEKLVPVRILNCPDSINVRIFPDEVKVRCRVAVSDYDEFKAMPFEVTLDLRKADLNAAEKIPVEVHNVPPFVNSLQVTPSKVDFLIEKKRGG